MLLGDAAISCESIKSIIKCTISYFQTSNTCRIFMKHSVHCVSNFKHILLLDLFIVSDMAGDLNRILQTC